MSLAHKLWRIGSILTPDHIKQSVKDESELTDPNYFNIDFIVTDGAVLNVLPKTVSVAKSTFFFSKKMGGSGLGIYYLYPNLPIQNSLLSDKCNLLINTVSKSCAKYASEKNRELCKTIGEYLADFGKYLDKADLEQNRESLKSADIVKKEKNIQDFTDWNPALISLATALINQEKGNYIYWFSINGKSFYELMPEVWDNWFNDPAVESDGVREGYDFFTGKMGMVGFRPDIKIFSYDNYHDSLNVRLIDNLSLSAESAKNIRFAWIYILDNLVFYYKGLEYIMIPNLLRNDNETLRAVIKRLTQARGKSSQRRATIKDIVDKERRLGSDIEKLIKKKDADSKKKIEEMQTERQECQSDLLAREMGLFEEINTNVNEIGDLKNAITLDFLFTKIVRKDLSFTIKGSIEDVIPSRLDKVVRIMKDFQINDNVKLKRDRDDDTPLQNFFNRNQLFFLVTHSDKNNINSILNEQLYLAKLLLTEQTIKMDDLLKRFELNREYSYDRKKRVTRDGIKEWIEYPEGFIRDETKLVNFFKSLNKIQE